jgi:hypothetical protein
MKRTTLLKFGLFIPLALALLAPAKCPKVPGTDDMTVTVVTEEFVELEFVASGDLNDDSDVETIDVDEIRADLEDLDVDISELQSIQVSRVEWGVTEYNEPATDRRITDGWAQVSWWKNADPPQGPQDIVVDLEVDVYPLLGRLAPPPIVEGGINFVNVMLVELLDELKNPTGAVFQVQGSGGGLSEPQERSTDFKWRLRIYYQLVGEVTIDGVDL